MTDHDGCRCLERGIVKLQQIVDFAGGDYPGPDKLSEFEAEAVLQHIVELRKRLT